MKGKMLVIIIRSWFCGLQLGQRIDKGILIEDMEGFTMKKLLMPGMDVLLTAMAMVEGNYPESLKQAYIINGKQWEFSSRPPQT